MNKLLDNNVDLSIVTSMYLSEDYIVDFYNRIKKVALNITASYEIIIVNDGSPDESLNLAVSLANEDEKIRVIDLSRNFGHHKAIMTGLTYALGKKVFLIDCDLEEEPELIERFNEEFEKRPEVDVVYGVQNSRKGKISERITSSLFYRFLNIISGYNLPEKATTVRMMSKRYVEGLLKHRETELMLAGLLIITGFNQYPIYINKLNKGNTTYNIKKKITQAINAITAFSNKPLIYIFYIGIFILFVSAGYITYLVRLKILYPNSIPGYASILVSIWILGGIILSALGIIGIYLSKVFLEVKHRPLSIVKNVYQKQSNNG